ncbi:seipin [Aspergillus tanneri]|uniref:Seipin n=1 Tax=Aspergillus tanneri TaxID=1220188 RepID=A0A5M9MGP4_9EURO|nr:uncharacterized protein ATNIH1004_007567 [Aspergillus tanneri]KAA8646141.1 hypothetical protein ATNIH1004_007567 [Aspergillus tanneri]
MEAEYAIDDGREEGGTIFLSKVMNKLVAYVQPLVSKQAQKAYLGTVLLFISAICMIFVSIFAYGIFYYKFIPQVGLERVVHLQFGNGNPWGTASLGPGLASLQPYDVTVKLELPRTPSNLATGNFMLDLTLFPPSSSSFITGANASMYAISRSRRPAILTYASPLVDMASKLSFMPLYVFGWHREAEILEVPMMEKIEFARGWRNVPDSLRLEIHSQEQMQVYKAKVEIRARFTGLRWMIYYWKITSFVVFTFLFWGISMTSASIVWITLTAISVGDKDTHKVKVKKEYRDDFWIKDEPLDESTSPWETSLDTSNDQPEQGTKREKEYQADDESDGISLSEDHSGGQDASGAGTGRESPEAQGIQRRRGHLSTDDSP